MSDVTYIWVIYKSVVRETVKAQRVDTRKGEMWIPKALIAKTRELQGKNGTVFEMYIPEWLARSKGLL